MPRPRAMAFQANQPPRESVPNADPRRQEQRIGPKLARLEAAIGNPAQLAELRHDPSTIAPDRAVVFEVASSMADFYGALRRVSFDLVGEDEANAAPDGDFFVADQGKPTEKKVPRRYYFAIPDQEGLRQLINLWRRYVRGEDLPFGFGAWTGVFAHLANVRPWGPEDRVTPEVIEDWRERLAAEPDEDVQFEAELWYRDNPAKRTLSEASLRAEVEAAGGHVLDLSQINEIRYHSALIRAPAAYVRELLNRQDFGLGRLDEVMVLRPQSLVGCPVEADFEGIENVAQATGPDGGYRPVAALLDGLPMTQHDLLAGRLRVDDPDEFGGEYAAAREQVHGTAMASLILHGDLNDPDRVSVRHPLYVRPVMYPHDQGLGIRRELMPRNRLGIDLIWRAILRMKEGEGGEPASAPTVRILNISLGDPTRQFAGAMSPWARLIDLVAWRFRLLVLVSAGNISDAVDLPDVQQWSEIEDAVSSDRTTTIYLAQLRNRSRRSLLSPAEAVNAITIGAAHSDHVPQNGAGIFAVDPYHLDTLPNLSSAMGLGYKKAVKPELLMPGGREHVRARRSSAPIDLRPVDVPGRYFGIGAAAPRDGDTRSQYNIVGTSAATALATHSSVRIYEALADLPGDAEYPHVPDTHDAVVLKALLVHAARWDDGAAKLLKDAITSVEKLHWEHERNEITRSLGFGVVADIGRVLECATNRATLVGWGTIGARQSQQYRFRLPAGLEGVRGLRSVTVTAAWLTPLNYGHRSYRMAKLEVAPGGDRFSLGVDNVKRQPSHNAVDRGTIAHSRWDGERAVAFTDGGDLVLDVTCRPTAGELDQPIPYGLALTLEVGAEIPIDIYEPIREAVRQAARVRT